MRHIGQIFVASILALVVFIFCASAYAASSECKGLEKTACDGNKRCSWVNSYKTSKGKDVAAFCRKKPERKTSSKGLAAPNG